MRTTKDAYQPESFEGLPKGASGRHMHTRVKISHLVASLPTTRQQAVFALLVPSCQQDWNKQLTTCDKLVDIIRLVVRTTL